MSRIKTKKFCKKISTSFSGRRSRTTTLHETKYMVYAKNMKFLQADTFEWKDKQGYSKKIFLDEDDLKHPGVLVQMIKIKARDEAKSHFHKKQTEIFYFLNTNGHFTVDGEKITPKIGDIIVVEPYDKHIVTNDTDADFLYLAFKIHYDENDSYWD